MMSWGEFRFTETIFAIEVKSVQINLNLSLYELVIMISSSI